MGAEVEIQGLVGAAHLNGRRARVTDFFLESGRYRVRLQPGDADKQKKQEEHISVRPANVSTLKRSEVSPDPGETVHFFLNDFDAHVIARNALLLECLLDPAVPDTIGLLLSLVLLSLLVYI